MHDVDALARQGNWRRLETVAVAWSREHPRNPDAWRALSRATFELGRYRASLEAFERVLQLTGRSAANLTTLARIALHAMDLPAAAIALDEAEALDPGGAELLAARALLLTYYGRFEEAEQYCRRALAHQPAFAPAYTTLGRLVDGKFSDNEMNRLTTILEHAGTPLDHRIAAAFALGHGYHARGDASASFGAWGQAHALRLEQGASEGRRYDPAGVESRIARLMSLFDTPTDRPAPIGPAPIFIVGMPRSGTTLAESIVSAHSRVRAGGERIEMQQILSAFLNLAGDGPFPAVSPATEAAWREAYWHDVQLSGVVDRLTDKHPLNLEAAGLIARLFPAARIVHVRRNPAETALSIYRNEFSKFWTFANRLGDIGHFYGQYARLAAHWERVLPGRFVAIQYEALAGGFTAVAPVLLEACGLSWEDGCMDFQHAARPITTFSAVRARQPVRVYSGAVERYGPHLRPLMDALERANVDPVTGAWRGAMTSAR